MTHHIFGPVISRRLGRSLGIDLLPFKTCTYNCIYCECGATTHLSNTREVFFDAQEVIAELDRVLKSRPELDYITFAGSGEPTLSLSMGQILRYVKDTYPEYSVAVLTNGSLCTLPEVRTDLHHADLIIPTITSTSEEIFHRIHRPVPGLSVSAILQGLVALRDSFQNQIWLEVFLVPPLNTTDEELTSLRDAMKAIRPDRVQLNYLDRPGTEASVYPPGIPEITKIRDYFSEEGFTVDIVGMDLPLPVIPDSEEAIVQIEETLKRRPCTAEDLAQMTGLHLNDVTKKLASLIHQGTVFTKRGDRGVFYVIPTEK